MSTKEEIVVDMTNGERKEENQQYCQVARCILDDGVNVPLDLKQAFLLPSWYDEKKFKSGQQYFLDNYFSLMVAKLSGLLVVLAVPSILKILILTNKSSHPLSAFRRYLDTISHMMEWYDGDLRNPNSRASKSLMNIRGLHCHATRKAAKAGITQITQRDMALTQFGFMGFAVLQQKELGCVGSEAGLEGLIHFWRVIGYLLGIKDKYNLCQGDVKTTRAACRVVCEEVFAPGLRSPTADFLHMSRALLEGMWALVPFIDTEAFLTFTQHMCGLEPSPPVNVYSRTLLNIQHFVHKVILNSLVAVIVRPLLNFNMWFTLFVAQRFPYLAFMAFGRNITAPEQFTITGTQEILTD